MVSQGHRIAVVRALLIGCAFLALHSRGAAAEEDRCEGTRTINLSNWGSVVTNDVPGCPNGGLLSGTDGPDTLYGGDGDDEMHGLDGDDQLDAALGSDVVYGGPGIDLLYGGDEQHLDKSRDVLYGGPGRDDMNDNDGGDDVLYGGDDSDFMLSAGEGEDVLYGGDGNDHLEAAYDGQRDKLYCGEGKDRYSADKIDYVDSSCEEGKLVDTGGSPLILLAGSALLLCSSGLVMSRYVFRRAS